MAKKKIKSLMRPPRPEAKKFSWLPLILIAVLTFLVYINTFTASFQFDDWGTILENPDLHTLNLRSILFTTYRPILRLSFALNYILSPKDLQGLPSPFGFHLVNFLLHLGVAYLFFLLARKLLAGFKNGEILALLAALFFSLHPVNTETVSYISSRSSIMCGFFYLLGLYLYWLFREKENWKYFIWAIVFFVCSVLSKDIGATFPLAMILVELYLSRSGQKANFAYSLPCWLLLLIGAALRMSKGGIAAVLSDGTVRAIPTHLFTELSVFGTYLRLLILPVHLNLDYDYPLLTDPSNWHTLAGLGLLILMLALLPVTFRKSKVLFFALAFYLINIVPVTIPILADLIFEHHLYLPLMGFALGLVVGLELIREKIKLDQQTLVIIMGIILILLSQGTFRRNIAWASEKALWEDTVAKSQQKARPHYNYGLPLAKRLKDYPRAVEEFKKAIALSDPATSKNLMAEYYYNLATAYYYQSEDTEKAGNKAESADLLNQALTNTQKALEFNPKHPEALSSLGNIYLKMDRPLDAKTEYEEALKVTQDQSPRVWGNLGIVYYKLKNYQQAVECVKKALDLNPNMGDAYNNLKVFADTMGRPDLAQQIFQEHLPYIRDPQVLQLVQSFMQK